MRRFAAIVALALSVTALAACSNSASVPSVSPATQVQAPQQQHDGYPPIG